MCNNGTSKIILKYKKVTFSLFGTFAYIFTTQFYIIYILYIDNYKKKQYNCIH